METQKTTESTSYQTSDGLTVKGVVFMPAQENGFAVICLHQLGLNRSSYEDFATKLSSMGFLVLVPDMRGHGESTELSGQTVSFESMTEDEFRKIPGLDVESAKAFLVSKYGVNPENIGLVGASIGANAALISAGRNPQTAFVVALSPGLDFRGIQPKNDVSQIQKPTLIVASQGDTYSTASSAELFENIPTKNKQIQIVTGDAHGTNMFQDQEVEALILNWIQKIAS